MSNFIFKPTKEQTEGSNIFRFMKKHDISSLSDLLKRSKSDPDWFWDAVSQDIGVVWDKKYTTVSDFSNGKQWPRWFSDGKINIINSTVEKFAEKTPNKIAYCFVSEDGAEKAITYSQLEIHVSKLANALKSIGVQKGDVVAIYMPMIFEAIAAMLACAKIGAVQTVIFSGYSTESLKIRLQDCNAKVLFVSDGFTRKGNPVSQKRTLPESIQDTRIEKLIIVPYKKIDRYDFSDSVLDYSELIEDQPDSCKTESMDSEDPLFILYTSGTTGRPKGVIHTHGGFSVYAGHQASYLIDLKPDDTLFWSADIGWITGQTWNVYGLLEVGATAIIYDGAIDWPNNDRLWKMLEKYGVTIFGTSPTAVRMFRQHGVEPRKQFNLDKIRIIPTTGEPIDEESWWWLYEKIGNKKVPIMNLAGGTEIGGAMLSVFPGMKLKPTTVGMPCPGFDLDAFDENQKSVRNKKGFLVVKSPWPTMTRGLLNDSERYIQSYWSQYKDVWFHGDYVMIDDDGLWYMYGRVDDVINVSGHRLSTVEIEQVVITHKKIADAAAISIPDKITGEAIVLFVVLRDKNDQKTIQSEMEKYISEKIGKIAKPKTICVISDMPKTRTGKVMRRLLKAKLLGEDAGDTSALENPHVLGEIARV
ncbi:MAG TPA: acetate--CoA ligase [Candidatus Nitrosotenuis sp.]|nr:acetate--CoA ligase [Candidatus Nitrosotenuis sp.]